MRIRRAERSGRSTDTLTSRTTGTSSRRQQRQPGEVGRQEQPEQARRLARKFEFIYTPVHGSWLNTAEIEISVLARQCLKRRLPDIETLQRETAASTAERNRLGASVEWRFTTADARIKLRSLYPSEKL
jgi:hypothetical protein